MIRYLRSYPALSLAFLAMVLGVAPLALVKAGLLPQGATQLGALSASLAGLILAVVTGGRADLRALLGRALIWRVPARYWLFALFFPILPSVAALYLYALVGGPAPDWSELKPIWSVIPMFMILTIFAGFGEEFGWRGYALPRLLPKFNALQASLLIGFLWGIWHTPLFLTEGTVQSAWAAEGGYLLGMGGYTAFCMAWSVQYTWLFRATRGSVLLAAVMHGAGNAWFGGYIDVYRGHLGGILTFAVVMALVSAGLVARYGPSLQRRDGVMSRAS